MEGHAQFIIATHSPILLAYPGAQLFNFDSPRIEEVAYEGTSHYKIYKQFFTDRAIFLNSEDSTPALENSELLAEKEVCH